VYEFISQTGAFTFYLHISITVLTDIHFVFQTMTSVTWIMVDVNTRVITQKVPTRVAVTMVIY